MPYGYAFRHILIDFVARAGGRPGMGHRMAAGGGAVRGRAATFDFEFLISETVLYTCIYCIRNSDITTDRDARDRAARA